MPSKASSCETVWNPVDKPIARCGGGEKDVEKNFSWNFRGGSAAVVAAVFVAVSWPLWWLFRGGCRWLFRGGCRWLFLAPDREHAALRVAPMYETTTATPTFE
jgi:hypothetical protein